MAYSNVSIPKVNAAGSPTGKEPNVLFIKVNQIAKVDGEYTGFPTRDGVKSASALTLKEGEEAVGVYITPTTINRFDSSEGDVDKKGWLHNFTGEHPGDETPFADFLQDNLNEDFVIITRECGDSTGTRLHGTPCTPMQFNAEGQDNNEGKLSTLTFVTTQRLKFKSMHYVHALPTIAADYEAGSSGSGGL